jgi:hypothetical protein
MNAPALPTMANAPADNSNAMKPKQPPACTFPLANITTPESTPEEYTFSEPQVVLTAPERNLYHIAEWLPDNQQVLMTEELGNNSDGLESISLYNPETGESKVFAIRPVTYQSPAWQLELNAVVYPVMKYFDINKQNHTYKFTRQLWVSYGDPNTAQLLDDNLPQIPLAINSDGNEMLYLSDKKISKLDKSLKKLSSLPFDAAQWDYSKKLRNDTPISYNMAWQPGTSLIFLYSEGVMGGGGYTFILDADTGRVCELNLGGWAIGARWSSDGRYLAIGRVTNSHLVDLTLLDTTTGNLTTLDNAPQGMEGQLYVNDFIWTPDNHHLLAIGSVISPQDSQRQGNVQGLYLVDIPLSQSVYITEYKSIVSYEDNNWAWSPDGSKLLMRCPTHVVDQICLISVQRAGQ